MKIILKIDVIFYFSLLKYVLLGAMNRHFYYRKPQTKAHFYIFFKIKFTLAHQMFGTGKSTDFTSFTKFKSQGLFSISFIDLYLFLQKITSIWFRFV